MLAELDLPRRMFGFEFSLKHLLICSLNELSQMSSYPSVRRDLSLLAPKEAEVGDILDFLKEDHKDILREVIVFDVFESKNLPKGKKSLGLGLILQDFSRTLNEEDVSNYVFTLLKILGKRFGVILREENYGFN